MVREHTKCLDARVLWWPLRFVPEVMSVSSSWPRRPQRTRALSWDKHSMEYAEGDREGGNQADRGAPGGWERQRGRLAGRSRWQGFEGSVRSWVRRPGAPGPTNHVTVQAGLHPLCGGAGESWFPGSALRAG